MQPKANKAEWAYGLSTVTVETPSFCGSIAQAYPGKRCLDRPPAGKKKRAESISELKSNESL
jgi:hypothetical protein